MSVQRIRIHWIQCLNTKLVVEMKGPHIRARLHQTAIIGLIL